MFLFFVKNKRRFWSDRSSYLEIPPDAQVRQFRDYSQNFDCQHQYKYSTKQNTHATRFDS